jgi:hypothetical protein
MNLTDEQRKALAKFVLEHAPDYDWDLAIAEGDWTQAEREDLDAAYRWLTNR